jgi:hypothetical protein
MESGNGFFYTLFDRGLLSIGADILSVFGFGLTCLVFLGLKEIRKKYLFLATVEKNLKNLKEHTSKLSVLLANFDTNRNDIRVVIEAIDAQLETFIEKISEKILKKRINKARGYIKRLLGDITAPKVRSLYASLNALNQSIENIVSDSRTGVS